MELTRVADCWSAVAAAEQWFEPGGKVWQQLVLALVPDSMDRRRWGRLWVPGFDVTWWWQSGATRLSTQRAVVQSCLVKLITNPSGSKDCISVQHLARRPLNLPDFSCCNFLGGVSPAAPWLDSDSAAVSVSYTKINLSQVHSLNFNIQRGHFELFLKREFCKWPIRTFVVL